MQHGGSGATLRLGSGESAMSIRARGRHRFGQDAKPNDITLTQRFGQWFLSVTLRVPDAACARERTGDERRGVDFRVTDWALFDDGQIITNPRWLREELPHLAALQRERARKRKGSLRFKRLGRRIARLHERIGNLRRDFMHKETTRMVQQCAVLATEQLAPQNMSRSAKGTARSTGPAGAAKGRTQPRNPLGRVRPGASDARVQSGRSWYVAASEQHAPAQTVAALRGVPGDRAQAACAAHSCLSALRHRHAPRPK